ncbi:pirin family protein [Halorhabdus amylolytica]|uniref:pirin family protein n=1 Tax=Halorhabdus amylolytica TaxID=2559573 RepID=UPI0010A9E5C8|nr:pirin family protein [Halorhabdus amylolytica]
MSLESAGTLHKVPRTDVSQNQGKFRTHFNFPGRNLPEHDDHGYGPLATVVESFMDPDTLISMHQHRNEEIISWVPAGVMRHDDGEGNKFVTDPEHLLVMNAGSGFWHEERTLAEDPPLRMLQIFVRPHSLDLEPDIQHEPIPEPVDGEWRHLFGPEGSDAPLSVRNAVHFYDVHLAAGDRTDLPTEPGWDTYFYVFDGAVTTEDTYFGQTESGLLVDGGETTVTAREDTLLVAFRIHPDAPITRQGTIGR